MVRHRVEHGIGRGGGVHHALAVATGDGVEQVRRRGPCGRTVDVGHDRGQEQARGRLGPQGPVVGPGDLGEVQDESRGGPVQAVPGGPTTTTDLRRHDRRGSRAQLVDDSEVAAQAPVGAIGDDETPRRPAPAAMRSPVEVSSSSTAAPSSTSPRGTTTRPATALNRLNRTKSPASSTAPDARVAARNSATAGSTRPPRRNSSSSSTRVLASCCHSSHARRARPSVGACSHRTTSSAYRRMSSAIRGSYTDAWTAPERLSASP